MVERDNFPNDSPIALYRVGLMMSKITGYGWLWFNVPSDKIDFLFWVVFMLLCCILGGGQIGHATQNLVKSARVRTLL